MFNLEGKKSTNSRLGVLKEEDKPNILKFAVMWKDNKTADVEVNYTTKQVKVKNYIDNSLMLPFPKNLKEVGVQDVKKFFESRCFPRERFNAREILKVLDVPFYEPYLIVRKTHGLIFDDFMWIKFEGEELTYDDIKIRD